MIPISRSIPELRSRRTIEKDLAEKLRKYENKIYWVENINKPSITNTGSLSCVYVDGTFLDEVSQAEASGISYSAIQIGLGLTGVTVITRLFSTLSIVTLSIVSITRPIPNIT